MTLREFMENLNEFIKEHPESLDLQVITSGDDEGNYYNPVYYTPSTGFFEDGEFTCSAHLEESDRDEDDINAVCIN